MFNRMPHEYVFGRLDKPGDDILLPHIVLDFQCAEAWAAEQEKALKQAKKR